LNSVYRWLFYVSPYSRIFEFLLGAVTAQLFLKWQIATSRPAVIAAWSALLAAFVTVCFSRQTTAQSTTLAFILYLSMNFALAPFIAAVIFVTAARDRAGVKPWPPIMIILGEASYSLYLTHPIVLDFGDTAGFPSPYLRFPAVLLLSCALALASYFAIEVPGRRLIRAAGNLRPRPAVSVG
jgi:peptidoglycan/LPS O-acetylase OafA/YrhL